MLMLSPVIALNWQLLLRYFPVAPPIRETPHSPQNLKAGGFSNPHWAQRRFIGVPHAPQNFMPLRLSDPQFVQCMPPLYSFGLARARKTPAPKQSGAVFGVCSLLLYASDLSAAGDFAIGPEQRRFRMKFGYFTLTDNPPAYGAQRRDPNQFLREVLEECQVAEELGYNSAWVSEHHFGFFGCLPAPATFLAYVAAKTTRIRLAPATVLLPCDHPVRVAE